MDLLLFWQSEGLGAGSRTDVVNKPNPCISIFIPMAFNNAYHLSTEYANLNIHSIMSNKLKQIGGLKHDIVLFS